MRDVRELSNDELLDDCEYCGRGQVWWQVCELRRRFEALERDRDEAQERINRVSAEAIAANSAAESAERDRDEAREAAKRAMSACGNPDAAEGCRNVLAILGAALNGGGPE